MFNMPGSMESNVRPVIPVDPEAEQEREGEREQRRQSAAATAQRKNRTSWVITIVIAVVLTLVVKAFLLQAYSIPSPSMVPTLNVGDRVIVSQLNKNPARGDIVVFDRPANDPKTNADDPDVLIKRVIGLPGESIESRDGKVFVDGAELDESYLPEGTVTTISAPIAVPSGKVLVLGDNRSVSLDGRVFGPIDKDLIVGRAVARIWPISRWSGL